MRTFAIILSFVFLVFATSSVVAQTRRPVASPEATSEPDVATASSTVIEKPTPTPMPRPDLTQKSQESTEPLKKLLDEQKLGPILPGNLIKHAIRGAVKGGVPPNTIVLLLLLPGVAALIAAARHLVGIRGFGIFLPAALSVVFVATGPFVGIFLFLVIVAVSTAGRIGMRKLKVKLQYLPRMALILHLTVLGILLILFAAPFIKRSDFANVSIFPVLILVLLAEDFSRVQLGKSAKVAVNLAVETLILALVSYVLLTTKAVQEFALLRPEILITSIVVFDILLGKYVGLRVLELWRFRKLVSS